MRLEYVLIMRTLLYMFNNKHSWETLFDHLKSKRIFTLDFYNLCISTQIMEITMTIFINFLTRSNSQAM